MIYFDNSATSRAKPPEVLAQTLFALTKYSANPGRSGHAASSECASKIWAVRENVAQFFGVRSPERIIFTNNCTEALNLAILGSAKAGGHIITTQNEHNSVLRCLKHLEKTQNISFSVINSQPGETIEAKHITPHIKRNTYMVVCNGISNVNGDEADLSSIGDFCKKHGLLFLVDGAQAGGHKRIDISQNNISFLALAGHKGLLASQGSGVLCVADNVNLSPIRFGGTGTEGQNLVQPKSFPEGFESGTLSVPAILSLGAGINYVRDNFDKIELQISALSQYALKKLANIDGVSFYTKAFSTNGVVAFNVDGVDCMQVANVLNDANICVRSGLHCAPLKHEQLKTAQQGGCVRASFSHFNTKHEIDKMVEIIKQISQKQIL